MNKRAGERCSRSYLCQGDCWEAKCANSVCNRHHRHNEPLDIEFLPLISLCWARDKRQEERCKCAFSKHSRTFRIPVFQTCAGPAAPAQIPIVHLCFPEWTVPELEDVASRRSADTASAQVMSWMEGRLGFLTYGSANVCTRKQALSAQNIRLIVSVPWGTHFPRPC